MTDQSAVWLGQGVHQIRIPLPFPSPRYVNAYAFETDRGLTLLDCGVNSEEGQAVLGEALAEIGGSLTVLIGSHLHIDHIGMARHLVASSGADFVMHASTPAEVAVFNDWEERRRRMAAVARRNGAPPEFTTRLETEWVRPDWYDDAVEPNRLVDEGDEIPLGGDRHLKVLYTPGHQANHICLIDSATGILYSGDHVLPRISPFVPYSEDEDTLADYLASIDKVEQLEVGFTLPAHGAEIQRGSDRAAQIATHHHRRLETMLDELRAGPRTAWEVMEHSFRPNLNLPQQRLAIQETLSHLQHLVRQGVAAAETDGTVTRFRRLR